MSADPMSYEIEVSREIAAPAEAVFAALADITRMGEWSPETVGAEWNEGFDAPAVGARFTGHNKLGEAEWSTEAEIIDYAPGQRLFFDCSVGDFVFSKWGYTVEPTDGGCRVTEYSTNLIPEEMRGASAAISGVDDRGPHNRAGMETTLERLAAACE